MRWSRLASSYFLLVIFLALNGFGTKVHAWLTVSRRSCHGLNKPQLAAFGCRMPLHMSSAPLENDQGDSIINHKNDGEINTDLEGGNGDNEEEEELTLQRIAELIDISFVQACMQLAQGYVDVLKLLIVSIQSAYDQSVTPTELIQEIDQISKPAAGRPLMPEEVRLRNTWIQVVYIMLSMLKKDSTSSITKDDLDSDIVDTYGKVAPILIRRRELSSEFDGKELLAVTRQLVLGDNAEVSPLEEAVLLNSLRVMWVTITVLEEVELCEGEYSRMDAKMPPKPPIPGAFE